MDSLRSIDISGYYGITFTTQPGVAPQVQWIELASLRIDDNYQRPIAQRGKMQVRRIAERFRWSRFAPIIVAPIEGGLFAVIDGQHRCHAAMLRGIKSVPCMVVTVDTAEQAEAFTEINTRQLAVRPAVLHKARVAARDAVALQVQALCEQSGVIIADNKAASEMKRGETLAVVAIYKLLDMYGEATLSRALEAIVKTGEGNVGMVRAGIVTAYCALFDTTAALRDHPALFDVLDEFDLPAAFKRMQSATIERGSLRWRLLSDEIEAFLNRNLKVAA